MQIYKEGDTAPNTLCHDHGLVEAVLKVRDITLEEDKATIKNVLVMVCPVCDQSIAVPHQSQPKFAAAYKQSKKDAAVELTVPTHYLDILNIAAVKIADDIKPEQLYRLLFKRYIFNTRPLTSIHHVIGGRKNARISMKFAPKMKERMLESIKQHGFKTMANATDVVISNIYDDFIAHENVELIRQIQAQADALR